jgi:hypothetical protein
VLRHETSIGLTANARIAILVSLAIILSLPLRHSRCDLTGVQKQSEASLLHARVERIVKLLAVEAGNSELVHDSLKRAPYSISR